MLSPRAIVHLLLHVIVPLTVALSLRRPFSRLTVYVFLSMMAGMIIDLDHLWADPVYQPDRCSVGFHPFHQWPAAVAYLGLTIWPKTRWVGIGLLIHLGLDVTDCIWMRWD